MGSPPMAGSMWSWMSFLGGCSAGSFLLPHVLAMSVYSYLRVGTLTYGFENSLPTGLRDVCLRVWAYPLWPSMWSWVSFLSGCSAGSFPLPYVLRWLFRCIFGPLW